MNVNIKTTNYHLTDDIRDYLEKKLGALDKLIDTEGDTTLAHVELGKTTKHHRSGNFFRAEINLRTKGHNFMAVAEEEDLKSAIDTMKDEIVREVKAGKEKFMAKVKRGAAEVKKALRDAESELS